MDMCPVPEIKCPVTPEFLTKLGQRWERLDNFGDDLREMKTTLHETTASLREIHAKLDRHAEAQAVRPGPGIRTTATVGAGSGGVVALAGMAFYGWVKARFLPWLPVALAGVMMMGCATPERWLIVTPNSLEISFDADGLNVE